MKYRNAAITILVLLCAVLCIRQIGEPDVWWQIRTGEYILQHGQVPHTDVFSFTYNGEPWLNVKWGTEVIMALISDHLGPEFLMLMQFVVLVGIVAFLYGIFRQLTLWVYGEKSEAGTGFFMAMLIFLFAMSYRINARPEMMSHLLSCAFIYLMIRDVNLRDKWIWLLIPLQILWANLHEGYGVGVVLILIYNAAGWFQFYFQKKQAPALNRLRLVSLVSVIAIFGVAIHPSGTAMLTQPFEIFGQLGSNKFTTELAGFQSREFWKFPTFTSFFILIFCLWFLNKKIESKKRFFGFPLFYNIIFLAFLYLSLQAYRNLPFFLFISIPLMALALQHLMPAKKLWLSSFFVLGIGFYLIVASGIFYEKLLPKEKYGLRVDVERNPIGAAQFLKQNQVKEPGFTDYFSSSFLLWYLQPHFKSYLDLRDLDVFEENFITNNLIAYTNPALPTKFGKPVFDYMDDKDNFNYVLMVNNIEFRNFHVFMNHNSNYSLVYVDPSSSIYLKKDSANAEILKKYENAGLDEKYHFYGKLESPAAAVLISKIFCPFYRENIDAGRHGRYKLIYQNQYMR